MTIAAYTSDPFTYAGGGLAVGVPVRVYFTNTSVSAALYEDSLGAVRASNPQTTDNAGVVSFFIEPGTYDLMANGARTTVVVVGPVDPPGPDNFITLAQAQDLDATVLADANAHSDTQDAATLASANSSASAMVSDLASSTTTALNGKADAAATSNALALKADLAIVTPNRWDRIRVVALSNGGTDTMTATDDTILVAGSNVASYTINLPSNLTASKLVTVKFNAAITALTVGPGTKSAGGANLIDYYPTSPVSGESWTWLYNAAIGFWMLVSRAPSAALVHTHQATDIINGAWTAPDLTSSSWVADTSGTYYSLAFRSEGDKTIGRGRVTLASPTNYVGGTRILTLPAACRPLATVVLDTRSGNTGASGGFITVDTAGVMSYSASITNATGFIFMQMDDFGFYKGAL